jgi:hypothetical protein
LNVLNVHDLNVKVLVSGPNLNLFNCPALVG